MLELVQEYVEKLKKVDEQLNQLMSDRKIIETELSALATAIKEQSETFGKVISFSHDCSCIIDRQSRFTYISPAGAKLLGLKQFIIIGKNWRELGLSREIMIPFEAHLQTVFLLGTPVSNIAKVTFPYGIRYIEYFLNPILDRNNFIAAVFCVARDVTQHKQSTTIQQQLTLQYLNEAQQLQQLVDTAPIAIVTVDKQGFITAINRPALKILPHIKKKFSQEKNCPPSSFKEIFDEASASRIFNGENIRPQLYEYHNKQFLASAHPLRNHATGQVSGAVLFYQDITELESLRQHFRRLDRLQLLGEMAAGVAHEIRNPMTTVRGYLQYLQGKAKYADDKDQFNLMIEELDRANTIITEFLSLARNKALHLKAMNLNHILDALLPLIESDALGMGHEVRFLKENVPDLQLDEEEIRQLILNIVRNGLEAMNSHGLLTIKTSLQDHHVLLAIQDTGSGIPDKVMQNLGSPFVTTKASGTGIGLSVCYKIVERHHAKIDVETSPNGTTFYIRFPILAASANKGLAAIEPGECLLASN